MAKIAELIVRLATQGGDKVKKDLDETKKAVKETANSMDILRDAVNETQIGGKGIVDIYSQVKTTLSSMTPEAARLAIGMGAVGVAATGMVAAIGGITTEAYKMLWNSRTAGMEFEAMQRRLEGLTGSASRAASILALARKEAGPSMFTTSQLEQASVMLAAYGVNVERILPLITRLGQAFGADQEHLMMYSRAFGQLASGKMPESEVMAQMGISKNDLRREGIKFDSQNSLISSAEETGAAFQRIIYRKFQGAYEQSTTTMDAMVASITDSMETIQRVMGKTVNDAMKPFVISLGQIANKIGESNFPKMFAEDMMKPFQTFGKIIGETDDAIKGFMATLAAMANIVPGYFAKIFGLVEKVKSGTPLEKIAAAAQLGSEAMKQPGQRLFDTVLRFIEDRNRYLGVMNPPKPPPGPSSKDDPSKRKMFPDQLPEDKKEDKKHKKEVESHLSRISNNTRKTADVLDLRNQTLGGGRIGSLGITGAELASMGMRSHNELSKAKPMSGDTMVNRGIRQMIQNNIGFAVNGGRAIPVR